MGARSFEEAYDIGEPWEIRFALWAVKRGWHVLPTYSLRDGVNAPALLAPGGGDLVLPDLLCMRGEQRVWIEVKWKEITTIRRNPVPGRPDGNFPATGIAKRLFDGYRAIQAATRIPVTVAFVHSDVREVRMANLEGLERATSYENTTAQMGAMIFWAFDELSLRDGAFDEIEAMR